MKKKHQQKAKKNHPPSFPQELKGLGLLGITFLLFISLITYANATPSTNWLGFLGYCVGWIFQYMFGLGSFLIAGALLWISFRMLVRKPIEHFGLKCLYFFILLFSSSILLNLLAEVLPSIAQIFDRYIYTETTTISTGVAYKKFRYNLGGVPFYYIYRDLPVFNFQHLLSNVGTLLVFSITFLVAALQLTHWKLFNPLYRGLKWLFKAIFQKSTDASPQEPIQKKAPFQSNVNLSSRQVLQRPNVLNGVEPPNRNSLSLTKRPQITPKEAPSISLPKEPSPLSPREIALEAQKVVNGDFAGYNLPPLSLLTDPKKTDQTSLKKDLQQQAQVLEETLLSFGIEAKVGQIYCGPTIALFEVLPAVGVKVQKIKALENDIALNLQAKSIRIIAPIPGKAAVGIEVPNPRPQEVSLKELLASYLQAGRKMQIPALLGKIVTGEEVVSDLAKMPHCIIAGATGSGKSVCINTIVMSILMTARPDEIKLLMVDPKKVELSGYSELPHMIAPVITDPAAACAALNWLVKEMERRYNILKKVNVRNIVAFNSRNASEDPKLPDEEPLVEKLPYIVAIIDELADLMMLSAQDIETPIARIAQMARAVGIHLILATQRPSREVITGLIRANFPARIAFKVASRVNSQIILDDTGAESLLGNGDMLFLPPGTSHLMRAQGAFIRDEDINKVVRFICDQAPPSYLISSFDSLIKENSGTTSFDSDESSDSLYDQAVQVVRQTGNASTTFLQRKLKIGYARAAGLMDQMEESGIVGPADGSKPRKILPLKGAQSFAFSPEEE